ncbi:MAG: MFS transporter [Pseudomonadota bacterium]
MSRRWTIFALASANFFLSLFYRSTNAVIAPQLLHDLSLNTKDLGLLSGAFFYGFALMQIPITLLLDKVGPRRLMSILSLFSVSGALIFSFSETLTTGVIARFLLGMGMACHLMGTLKLLTLWFGPLRFATLSGIVLSIGTMGNIAATSPFVLLVGEVGWRSGMRLIAVINFVLLAAFYVIVRDTPHQNGASSVAGDRQAAPGLSQTFSHVRLLFRNRSYWIISLGTFTNYGVFAAFQTLWAGPYLMEVMGLSPIVAGNLIFLISLGYLIAPPISGILSDRILKTRKWIVLWGLVIYSFLTAAIAILSPGTYTWVFALLFFCFGFFRATASLMYTQIKELMPLGMAGTAMTGINFFTMIGPAFFLHGIGWFMQTFYPHAPRGAEAFRGALLVCAFCLAVVSLVYLFTRDTKGQSP